MIPEQQQLLAAAIGTNFRLKSAEANKSIFINRSLTPQQEKRWNFPFAGPVSHNF